MVAGDTQKTVKRDCIVIDTRHVGDNSCKVCTNEMMWYPNEGMSVFSINIHQDGFLEESVKRIRFFIMGN